MRFINSDPIGFSGGMNWFAYGASNPITNLDPNGLNPMAVPAHVYQAQAQGMTKILNGDPEVPRIVHYGGHFTLGLSLGVIATTGVVAAAPVVVTAGTTGLTSVGVPATIATTISSGTVTTGLGVAAAWGGFKTVTNTYGAIESEDWSTVAYNSGAIAGGFMVGAGSGGRALAEGMMGRPSPAPNTWNPLRILQYEWAAGYRTNYPGGSLPSWMASAPTPASGGASAAFISAWNLTSQK